MTASCCCKKKKDALVKCLFTRFSLLSQNRISGFFTTSVHFCSRRIVSTNLSKQELNCLSYFSTMCTTIKTWWVGGVLCDLVCCCAFLSTFPPSFPPSSSPSLPCSSLPPFPLPFLFSSLPSFLLTSLPPFLFFLPSFLPASLPPSLPCFLASFLLSWKLPQRWQFFKYGEEKEGRLLRLD